MKVANKPNIFNSCISKKPKEHPHKATWLILKENSFTHSLSGTWLKCESLIMDNVNLKHHTKQIHFYKIFNLTKLQVWKIDQEFLGGSEGQLQKSNVKKFYDDQNVFSQDSINIKILAVVLQYNFSEHYHLTKCCKDYMTYSLLLLIFLTFCLKVGWGVHRVHSTTLCRQNPDSMRVQIISLMANALTPYPVSHHSLSDSFLYWYVNIKSSQNKIV